MRNDKATSQFLSLQNKKNCLLLRSEYGICAQSEVYCDAPEVFTQQLVTPKLTSVHKYGLHNGVLCLSEMATRADPRHVGTP